ncbi:MAG: DUF1987 domain-containing protein [Bacteroidales bacterium]
MESLSLKGNSQHPEVLLDQEKGVIEFSGNSLPEDAKGFFDPIINWIDKYIEVPNNETTVSFRMSYYNTPSSKLIYQILKKFEGLHSNQGNVNIIWHFPNDDPDMKEAGKDYAENIKVPFKFQSYEE